MPRLLLLEEIHLSLLAPDDLTTQQLDAIRRVLGTADFRAGLQRLLLDFLATHPDLADVRVRVGR